MLEQVQGYYSTPMLHSSPLDNDQHWHDSCSTGAPYGSWLDYRLDYTQLCACACHTTCRTDICPQNSFLSLNSTSPRAHVGTASCRPQRRGLNHSLKVSRQFDTPSLFPTAPFSWACCACSASPYAPSQPRSQSASMHTPGQNALLQPTAPELADAPAAPVSVDVESVHVALYSQGCAYSYAACWPVQNCELWLLLAAVNGESCWQRHVGACCEWHQLLWEGLLLLF